MKMIFKWIYQFFFFCLSFLLTVVFTAIVTFTLLNLLPGDISQIQLGLSASPEYKNDLLNFWNLKAPFFSRLYDYLYHLFHLDFGVSYVTGLKVSQGIFKALPYTILLALIAFLYAIVFGVLLGFICAYYKNKKIDSFLTFLSTVIISLPSFVIGIILIQLFILKLSFFTLFDSLDISSFILPSLTLGLTSGAFIFRTTRFSVIRASQKLYVPFFKHYQIPTFFTYKKFVFKDILNPLLTLSSLEITGLLAGAFVTETLFGIPGMGQLLTQAISQKDTPTIMGGVIVISILTYFIQKLMECLYKVINPQLHYQLVGKA